MPNRMALKAIMLLLLFATVTAEMVVISAGDAPVPANECSKGPEHWCTNIMTAKSCHATRHCIQTVWERQTVSDDSDSICEVCKQMVEEARDQLMSNETQEEMKEVFEGSCNLLPIKMVRMNCIKVVDEFIPELIEMLASQMNPTMVCTTALLCNNAWTDGLLAEYAAARKTVPYAGDTKKCGTCRNFMSHNNKKLRSTSLYDIQDVLFDACDMTSSFSDGCKALVADNIGKIYEFLNLKLKDDVCDELGFCKADDKPMQVAVQPLSNDRKFETRFQMAQPYNDDLECEFCETLIENVRRILISNTSESEFIQVLNGICRQTGEFAKQCQSLVDEYGDVVYSYLSNEVDPLRACRLLTLCPYPGRSAPKKSRGDSYYMRVEPTDILQATKLTPAEKVVSDDLMVGQDEANSFVLPAERLEPIVMAPRKPSCVLCEYVLHQIVDDLRNQTVQEEVEHVVKNICKNISPVIRDECDKLIDTYADAIFFLLSQEFDPSTMCVTMQMCPARVEERASLPPNPFRSAVRDPNSCALCEFVITTLDKRLEDNRTEESVRQALDNLCEFLPKSVRKDCTRLVDAYAKQIIEMIVADLTPDEVCAALKMCNPKSETRPKNLLGIITSGGKGSDITLGEFVDQIMKEQPKQKHPAGSLGEFLLEIESQDKKIDERKKKPQELVKNTPTCVMCEFAMSTLEKHLITNNTEEQVRRAIDFLCAHLPTTVADMCIDFVEQYGDEIFELLVSEVAPKAVCTQLGLCLPTDLTSVRKLGHMNEHKKISDEDDVDQKLLGMPSKCEICQTAVEYLDKLLEDDTIEESIDHIIERACALIPRGARDKCTSMVDTYGPYFISQLGLMMNATKVCQSVHLCKPPAGQVQLLGGKQCTWGPAYWCISPEHAAACNNLEHCQTKVWMKEAP